MKKRYKIIMLLISWIIVAFVLYRLGLITTNFNKINTIIGNNPVKMRCLFVLLSTFRVVLFIPQTVFIICGDMVFSTHEVFFLSVLSLVISQSIMYAFGRYFQKQLLGDTFLEKNKETIEIIKKHGYKVLALGIACPVTPSDLITVSAACIKLEFMKCIATTIMADAPMIFLYSLLGNKFNGTIAYKIFVVLAIIIVSYYSLHIWNKIKRS